jgi:acetyl-CoA C-acetyltransferase
VRQSQQALHFAAQAVMSGTQDVVLAGGVQTMTQIPISSAMLAGQPLGFTDPFSGSKGWQARFGDAAGQPVLRRAAHRRPLGPEPRRHGVFAWRATAAPGRHRRAGHFEREIVPLEGVSRMDETPAPARWTRWPAGAGGRRPTRRSPPPCRARPATPAAVLVVSEAALKRYGLTPRARIHHLSVLATTRSGTSPRPSRPPAHALKKAGMSIE